MTNYGDLSDYEKALRAEIYSSMVEDLIQDIYASYKDGSLRPKAKFSSLATITYCVYEMKCQSGKWQKDRRRRRALEGALGNISAEMRGEDEDLQARIVLGLRYITMYAEVGE